MTNQVVKLSRRYEAHGTVFDEVTVREPRFEDLMTLGEPYEVQKTSNNVPIVIENTAIVADYVERCVVKPGIECMVVLGIKDARAVRGAVLGFFLSGAPQEDPSSTTSPTAPTT
jgi:hypothetical protein